MANSEAKQSNSIYYNIDIYNDNATGADISSKFQTAFNSPLLMDTSNYEVAVARARIPLDQIPLSQENIPFQKWQIEIGVPSTMSENDYTYYSSYVPQFLPNIAPYSLNTALVGFVNTGMFSTITIDSVASPSGNVPIVYGTSPILMSQEILNQVDVNNTISNSAFTKNFGYYVDVTYDPVIYQCAYTGGTPMDTWNVNYIPGYPGYPGGNTRIIGLCSDQTRDSVYMLLYNTDSGSWYIYELISGIGTELPTFGGIPLPQNNPIFSMSCDAKHLTLSCGFFNELIVPGTDYVTFIFDISGPISLYKQFNNINPITSFIDYSDGNYYTAPINDINLNFYQNLTFDNSQTNTYYPPNNLNALFVRFLGTDTWNNLLVCFKDTIDNTYSIVAYNKNFGGSGVYTIQMGNQIPVTLSNFTTVSGVNTLPSLSPNYQVMTINDYLRQINMGFVDVFVQIPQPYSSPTAAPRLVYNSSTAIVSIVTDVGCASSSTVACVINFNQLLWSLFKFNSIAAVNTALPATGGVVRTLTINDPISPALVTNTPQPSSTMYRFSDLTRIIIGTTRMGVYGDNQNNDKLLVNICDFTVDTENGIPNLIIYNPFILRFYKLYQNTPLTNIDVFVSYANRAGDVFPITISPYNSIGLKLEFQRIPMTIQ